MENSGGYAGLNNGDLGINLETKPEEEGEFSGTNQISLAAASAITSAVIASCPLPFYVVICRTYLLGDGALIFIMDRKSFGLLIGRFTVVAVFLLVVACGEKKPSANTPEYRAAHGIVEGSVNLIEVAGDVFQLPPGADFDVYSYGDIKMGEADKLIMRIHMSHAIEGKDVSASANGVSVVWVDILKMGDTQGKTYLEAKEDRLGVPVERKSLDLVEYPLSMPLSEAEYSGEYIYVPADGVSGNGREFFCSVARPKDPSKTRGDCRAFYYLSSGLLVDVLFDYRALPNWKAIMEEVRQTVEGIRR
ncbi:hypothetical protein ACNKH9_00495 [Metapseudomonas otitidis]|uniref:hypothetical protein n=1 Tax=Metapseudomonas otitidis TaxID=319939 RepID=UPI003A89F204